MQDYNVYRVYTNNGHRYEIRAQSDVFATYLAMKTVLKNDPTDDITDMWTDNIVGRMVFPPSSIDFSEI